MTKSSKTALIIIALVFIVWGADDFYHYATIGKEVLDYFDGAQVIKELVQYQFLQGFIKTLIGVLIAAVPFFKRKKN